MKSRFREPKGTLYGGIYVDRPLITESYWQRGCDDAKAGRQPALPMPGDRHGTQKHRAARMLTSDELADCCGGCRTNSAIDTWMRRAIERFCAVNNIRVRANGVDTSGGGKAK